MNETEKKYYYAIATFCGAIIPLAQGTIKFCIPDKGMRTVVGGIAGTSAVGSLMPKLYQKWQDIVSNPDLEKDIRESINNFGNEEFISNLMNIYGVLKISYNISDNITKNFLFSEKIFFTNLHKYFFTWAFLQPILLPAIDLYLPKGKTLISQLPSQVLQSTLKTYLGKISKAREAQYKRNEIGRIYQAGIEYIEKKQESILFPETTKKLFNSWYGASIQNKGMRTLFVGDPGTGKSGTAQAFVKMLSRFSGRDVTVKMIQLSEFSTGKYQGKKLHDELDQLKPGSIVLMDEFFASIGGRNLDGSISTEILQILDGAAEGYSHLHIIAMDSCQQGFQSIGNGGIKSIEVFRKPNGDFDRKAFLQYFDKNTAKIANTSSGRSILTTYGIEFMTRFTEIIDQGKAPPSELKKLATEQVGEYPNFNLEQKVQIINRLHNEIDEDIDNFRDLRDVKSRVNHIIQEENAQRDNILAEEDSLIKTLWGNLDRTTLGAVGAVCAVGLYNYFNDDTAKALEHGS